MEEGVLLFFAVVIANEVCSYFMHNKSLDIIEVERFFGVQNEGAVCAVKECKGSDGFCFDFPVGEVVCCKCLMELKLDYFCAECFSGRL